MHQTDVEPWKWVEPSKSVWENKRLSRCQGLKVLTVLVSREKGAQREAAIELGFEACIGVC